MEKARLKYFDLVSGLFMVQIIVMHILQFSENIDNKVFNFVMHISFFFMPWFYFKSGYMYTPAKHGTKSYLLGKAKSLLLPFALFTLIGFALSFPFEITESGRSVWRILLSPGYAMIRWGNGGNSNQPIWFLLSLFFALIGFMFFDKLKIKQLIILFPVFGYLLYHFNLNLPLGLSNLFLSIFFLYTGHIFRHYIEGTKYSIWLLWIAVAIYGLTQLFYFSYLDMRINTVISGDYFVYLVSALSGLLVTYFIAKKADYFKPLNYIGENSMVYFVVHWPIMFLIKNILDAFSFKTTGYLFAVLLSVIVFGLLPLCVSVLNGRLKVLIGK